MALETYTGRLTDFGGTPFPNATPRLWIEPERTGFTEGGVLATKRIPVTLDPNGDFSVKLHASSTVRPEAIYVLKCEWLDGSTVLGWAEWMRFRAPVGGGDLGEINQEQPPTWAILYGDGPPPEHLTSGLYIDISGPAAVLYGPESGRI